jgi:protein-tyrosine-phosphatase
MYTEMKKVLFVCVHNAGRSQMAEAFFNGLAEGKALALSAGTEPASRVNSVVVKVMREVGIDIRHQEPKLLMLEMLENVDRVITMGCSMEKACPASFVPTEEWNLEDPEGKSIEEVRQIRDKTKARVEELLERLL